jgi:hypothetical protein
MPVPLVFLLLSLLDSTFLCHIFFALSLSDFMTYEESLHIIFI